MSRKINTREQRDKFYIITNGKETEYNYFSLLKAKKSIYDVKVEFQNLDPFNLVKYSTKYLNEANQIWTVFDIDNTYEEKRLLPAISLAQQYNINYAYSNLAFEVWLISHFEQCIKPMTTKEHEKILTNYLNNNKPGLKYNKGSLELLRDYFIPNYRVAIENSKFVYQTRIKEHKQKFNENIKPEFWKWNSSTNVFKLVEALKLTVK